MNIEQLREICLSFPHATEDVKWDNDLCSCVGGKMFCVTGLDQADFRVSFKCTPEKFSELIEKNGIIPAPYVARYHWVAVADAHALSDDELEDLISKSYLMVYQKLSQKLRKSLSK